MKEATLWELLDRASRLITDPTWREDFNKVLRAPVNPNTNEKARTLLDLLYSYSGNRLITGQHEYLEAPNQYAPQVLAKTGLEPLLKGVEYGGISGQTPAALADQRLQVTYACSNWYKLRGGIVTATYHAVYPGSAPTWANVQRYTTQAEFNQIVTPGTDMYNKLLADIDLVASYLKILNNAGVPIIWRPYHEMNGGWFWWGNKTNFSALWEIMFDRYTNYHGLNNLIWAWCPNAENPYTTPSKLYYVGHHRTDIVAQDIYDNDYQQKYYDSLRSIGQGKLLAIGECGQMPDPVKMYTQQPLYAWFMTWGSMLNDKNTLTQVNAVYKDPYTKKLVDPVTVPEPIVPGDGLSAEYFSDIIFNTSVLKRIDPVVDFNWGNNRPDPAVTADNFSVRWTGYLLPKSSEQYKLITNSDDGARIYIDDALVVNKWYNGSGWASGLINLTEGTKYKITVEFYDASAAALISMYWEAPTVPREVIPQANLYSA